MPSSRATSRLVVVSNRLPATPIRSGPASVGGLVSALVPALSTTRNPVIWFGWSGSAGRSARPQASTSRLGSITAVTIALPEDLSEGYYNSFCNGALWPILHGFPGRLTVEGSDYGAYRAVNAVFARTIARRLRADDRIWIHDFHLIPLGAELRRLGFVGRIGFFLHVPFPPPSVFALLPWAEDLLEDLHAYDLVGVHTAEYAVDLSRALEATRLPQRTKVRVHPIGIDPAPYDTWSRQPAALKLGKELRQGLLGRKLVLGVDRLDYTKGIPERLRIFGRLLELYPEWRRRVSFIQISAPSRTRVAEYVQQRRQIEELVGNLNGRHGDTQWVPVNYLFKAYGQRELAAFYREADVALVTPLRDGMNLVAKEYVAAQTGDPGVLVLSKFAGAAAELTDALIVNPYDIDRSAHELARALSMPLEERVGRQRALLATVGRQTAATWAEDFLRDLDEREGSALSLTDLRVARALGSGSRATREEIA